MSSHFRRDTGLKQIVERFVHSENFDERIFDRGRILQMMSDHYEGRRDHSELISILATSGVALEYFVYGRTMRCPDEARPVL
jgi:hypothetical protein